MIFQCATNIHTLTSAVEDRSAATNYCADSSDTIYLSQACEPFDYEPESIYVN
ncbi:hypothetical protein P692DRAFT_20836600 [Suillus brevipes Sb2]|nr:hypothetical protein P692DRAFT_20836600 [Suillus brevipes Sb2]